MERGILAVGILDLILMMMSFICSCRNKKEEPSSIYMMMMSFICSFRNKNEEGPRGSVYQFRPAADVSSRCVEVIRKCLLLACVNMRKRFQRAGLGFRV